MHNPSRREFLGLMAAIGTAAVPAVRLAAAQNEITTALNGIVGLQLWSLRDYLPKDLSGTLEKVRGMGFREVEGAGLWKHSVKALRAAMDANGLTCRSAHMSFERLRDDPSGAFDEAKALGATGVVCPWIPQDAPFNHDAALKSAEAFNRFAAAAGKAGLQFAYHCHGYEFVPSPEGTLFDTLAKATDPKLVMFQIDVFHALFGGADPVQLIERYSARVTSLHLKDLKKGVPIKPGTAIGTPEMDVPLGTGQVDMPNVLKAAMKAGVKMYYIEDESAAPLEHIPQSVTYLKQFRP